MANNNDLEFIFDYVLLFHEDDMDAVLAYHNELLGKGLRGCLYDDPTAAPGMFHYTMEKIVYLLQNSRVCLVYMTEGVCNVFERKLKHVLYTALDKCLSDKSYEKKLKPYYPESKASLERKGHTLDSLGAISGLERQNSYYEGYLQQIFCSSGLTMDEQNVLDSEVTAKQPIQVRDASRETFIPQDDQPGEPECDQPGEPQCDQPGPEEERPEEQASGEEIDSPLSLRWMGPLLVLSVMTIIGFQVLKSA